MLSVLIETKNDEEGLARTLSSLVAAAVEGVVRDVIVRDRGSTDGTGRVAEHAGCVWLPGADIGEAIRCARADWLLLLQPGARLEAGWTEAVLEHAAGATIPARFSRSRAERQPFLSRVFASRSALADGLVITKRQATALARTGGDAESIARGLATRRLKAEIRPAPVGR
jgi:hypothetical protein